MKKLVKLFLMFTKTFTKKKIFLISPIKKYKIEQVTIILNLLFQSMLNEKSCQVGFCQQILIKISLFFENKRY